MSAEDTDTHTVYRTQESRDAWTMIHVLIGIFSGVAAVIGVVLVSNLTGCHHG